MNVLMIVESCFGNTAEVAGAIAAALRAGGAQVRLVQADAAPAPAGEDLVMIGAPTHNMGLPNPASRSQAEAKGARAPLPGVGEWIDARPRSLDAARVVVFSTVTGGFMSGSASKQMAKRLRRHGVQEAEREDFRVLGTTGPLADGELERAGRWAETMLAAVGAD
ncbi:flavodoxin domain-containing protein [Acidipropionibacterium virtanenii]|uniref:Flavodoxin-like domain-containing protein n=1 Tax=Acidipropionibacterium virtanenii TaxID=2057246 RepID=A0A344UXA0_9ACTN|nr:flavodoxin domain-containing protein [Acidipropionibacterium virtanenii]AXE39898.1 hypothetical protein JS278_02763 [Acidipropionibacterium virtanenii]